MFSKQMFVKILILLCFTTLILQADDDKKLEKMPATNTEKYTLPTKKVAEFSDAEVVAAVSYLQAAMYAKGLFEKNKTHTTTFLNAVNEAVKNPKVELNQAEWSQLLQQYQALQKENKEFEPDVAQKFYQYAGIYAVKFMERFHLNTHLFIIGVNDFLAGKGVEIPQETQQELVQRFQGIVIAQFQEIGKKFLEENKTKEGVKVLPSGVQYKVLKEGSGAVAKDGQTLKVHYVGTTIEGQEFDSSVKRGETFDLKAPVSGVIQGWIDVLKVMTKGAKWQVFIPENLAYGQQEVPPYIKPYSTLVFEMEVVDIVDK